MSKRNYAEYLPPWKDITVQIENGRHSNFPLCCVLWYTFVWHQLWRYLPEKYILWIYRHTYRYDKAQYIRCPLCLITDRMVKVHWCEEACGVDNSPIIFDPPLKLVVDTVGEG